MFRALRCRPGGGLRLGPPVERLKLRETNFFSTSILVGEPNLPTKEVGQKLASS